MIREPTVGMRVKVSQNAPYKRGQCGEIITVDGTSRPRTSFGKGVEYWLDVKYLTEIKESDMKKGDLVTISSTKNSICLTTREQHHYEMAIGGDFKVIRFINGDTEDCDGESVHDIVLKNTETDNLWLHSKQFVVPNKVKELTVADIEEKYGCKVKIIK